MAQVQIVQNCPLTCAERAVVSTWATGSLTDKEAANELNKGHRTVRTQRESIASRSGAPEFKGGAGHLLIHLLDLGWLRFLVLTMLACSPVFEITQQIDINNERARRTRRREFQVVGRIHQIREI